MFGWRSVLTISVQAAVFASLMNGCESHKDRGGGGASRTYQCHNPTINVDVASVKPMDVYVCDDHSNKVIWNGNAKVLSFTIKFDEWFSGAPLSINSKTTGCGHDSSGQSIPVCAETPEVHAHPSITAGFPAD